MNLAEWFSYNPRTGVVRWRKTASNRAPVGSVVRERHEGYVGATLFGKFYLAHRIAHFIMTGSIPSRVDHKDRDRANNKWDNIRTATPSQNAANAARRIDNSTGYKGVSLVRGRYRARIRVNYRGLHLGYFKTPEEAHAAYTLAAKKLFGAYARSA
jgi:hypothetical protein